MARARATDVQAVIAAAADVFHAKGFRKATIDDIAASAQVSRPTVYAYAKSKQWLFDRVVLDLIRELERLLREAEARDGTARDRLEAAVAIHVDTAVEHGNIISIAFNSEVDLSPSAHEEFLTWARVVTRLHARLIEGCIAEGSMESALSPSVSSQLLLTVLTSIQRWYRPRAGLSRDQLTQQVLTLVGVEPASTP